MTEMYTPLQFESFIVRFWQERDSQIWHGKVIHLRSRETCEFATLAQAETFFCRFGLTLSADEPDASLEIQVPRSE